MAGDLTYNGYWRVFSLVLDVRDGWITELSLTLPNEKLGKGTINVKSHRTAWDWRKDHIVEHGLLDNVLCGRVMNSWSDADFLYATLVDVAEKWLETR